MRTCAPSASSAAGFSTSAAAGSKRFRPERARAPPKRGSLTSGAAVVLAAQEGQHGLRGLVGLRQHGRAGLLEDLVLGEVDHLRGHVDVLDAALGRLEVLLVRGEVVERVLEAVLNRTER